MARRRGFSVISMSFLDAMTCGFGAVILFFMIISANVDLRSDEVLEDRSAEARRLELQVEVGQRNLAELREALATLLQSRAETIAAREQVAAEIEETREEIERLLEDSSANEEMIEQLEADLARLETEAEDLASASDTIEQTGDFIREIRGEGYRQYLTGLRMGGQRLLILVDVSRSMLGKDYPEIVRRSILDDDGKRNSRKWRQVVDTVDWLTAQIEPGTQFQVIAFNTEAWVLVEPDEGQWLTATDGSEIARVLAALNEIVPNEGTNLYAALDMINQFAERPDNVYLLVDGLPTRGATVPRRESVTGRERLEHFNLATRVAPRSVPINVLLYALEGDPYSAPAYWSLALQTGGSMMAPSEDWP